MVAISHDRYLLRRLIDRFIWLHDGTWHAIEGGFEAYERAEIAVKRGGVVDSPVAKKAPSNETVRESSKRGERAKRDVEKWEAEVARLDARRADIEREFADPVLYDDADRLAKLHAPTWRRPRRPPRPRSNAGSARWRPSKRRSALRA